jgi:hypothetical protein
MIYSVGEEIERKKSNMHLFQKLANDNNEAM